MSRTKQIGAVRTPSGGSREGQLAGVGPREKTKK
jgi:hypothetical protein